MFGKNLPRIAMAHGIPFVATASVADLHDLETKVTKAMSCTRCSLYPYSRTLSVRVEIRSGTYD